MTKMRPYLIVCGLITGAALAAPLTAPRNTPQRAGAGVVIGVYTNTRILAGSLVAVNSSGYAVPASDTSGLKVIGCAMETVDNRTNAEGAGDSGAKTVTVKAGIFRWVNGGSLTDADIGSIAYVEDDQTVSTAAEMTYDIVAGVIVDVDADGVWVSTYNVPSAGAASVTTLAASGNASIGGTLAVTGATTLSNLVVNGNSVTMGNLPTSTNGLTAGRLYVDSGALKVYAP